MRSRAGLRALRSILVGIIVVAASGLVGALVSYRADVAEARHQVRKRVARQARASADALAARFSLLANELQRFAHRRLDQLITPDAEMLAVIHDDRSLFEGGVVVLGLDGKPRWSDPPDALAGLDVGPEPWFQRVLATEQTSVDALSAGSSRVAVAVPFTQDGTLVAVLVGIVTPANSLLTGIEGEVLLALSGSGQVVLPTPGPPWAGDLSARVSQLHTTPGEATWRIGDDELIVETFHVKGTALEVLALESETVSVENIRRRLNLQLAFLSVLQVVTLAAFFWFLRATYRTFAEVEAAVAEQEKMVALGTAASLIAHEVKNSLNGLKAATSLLEAGGDASLASKTMKGQVERLGHLASSLLSFSRPTQPRRARFDTSAIVREAVEGLRSLPEYGEAAVELALPADLPLETDPLLLTTAVDNLVRNAIEAAVTAKDTGRVGTPRVRVSARKAERHVVIEIDDNAGGPPEGFEARLGEPFFTTKSRGIGLGLAMTRRAAEQLGGALRFERTAEGSRFSLELPA